MCAAGGPAPVAGPRLPEAWTIESFPFKRQRSPKLTHFCSREMTQTEITIGDQDHATRAYSTLSPVSLTAIITYGPAFAGIWVSA